MVKVKGQCQIFPKRVKKQITGHISKAILPTDFILGTKVQPNKARAFNDPSADDFERSRSKVRSRAKVKVKGQVENFPKMG